MENDKYIRTDENKVINEKYIRWVKKMDECLTVCIKANGCIDGVNTHKICKINNYNSYIQLIKLFE